MNWTLRCLTLPDPDGHNPMLLLRGDWLLVAVSDGVVTGLGEASHSGDDARCARTMQTLFARHIADSPISLDALQRLARGPFAGAPDFVTATAISALDQALHDLLARREGVPVWRLYAPAPHRQSIPLYATINRALTGRTPADYLRTVETGLAAGFQQLKCAPFDQVVRNADVDEQVAQAAAGLALLALLRRQMPDLDLRVDCHGRFRPDAFRRLIPAVDHLHLRWIEEPAPLGSHYAELRAALRTPLAVGELDFGLAPFQEIANRGWAHVVMPDVKHVGGFGPLLRVCRAMESTGVQVSPHNPSGPISTLASLHAAALAPSVTSLETPLRSDGAPPHYHPFLHGDRLHLPHGPGWGLTLADLGLA